MISGWVQKVTEHRGTIQYIYVGISTNTTHCNNCLKKNVFRARRSTHTENQSDLSTYRAPEHLYSVVVYFWNFFWRSTVSLVGRAKVDRVHLRIALF